MGSCGCCDHPGEFRFKGPDNSWYILQIYPSCQGCGTAAGITIYKFATDEMKDWGAEQLPIIDIPYDGKAIEVIHPRLFLEGLEAAELCENGFEGLEDDFYSIFRKTVWETNKQENNP